MATTANEIQAHIPPVYEEMALDKKDGAAAAVLEHTPTVDPALLTQASLPTSINYYDTDTDRLARMGYKQEMRRSLSLVGIVSLAFTILSLPFGIMTTFIYGLIAGGPAAFIYNWIMSGVLTLCMMLSLAEICSKYPTAGSVYYWSAIIAPPNATRLCSWIAAWLNIVGELCGLAAIEFSMAQFILGLVEVFHPAFVATAWQVVLLYWACILLAFAMNLPGGKGQYLDKLSTLGMAWTVLGLVIVVPVMLGKSEIRHDAHYAFTAFDNTFSGFSNTWSWLLASLTPVYCMVAAGNVSTLCEEVKSPEKQVPKAMWLPVVLNGVLGTLFLIGVAFVLPDIGTLVSVPSGQPGPLLFYLTTRSSAATIVLSLLILGGCFGSGIFSSACLSRFIYGFARDGGIPGSSWLRKIHPSAGIPINALIAQSVIAAMLGLIYIGSTAAFNALIGCAIACLCASFMMPIALNVLQRRRHVQEAAFSLGSLGFVLNVVALLWGLLIIAIASSPLGNHPTAATMNYASVFFVFFAAISAAWYLIWGRAHFVGPNVRQTFH